MCGGNVNPILDDIQPLGLEKVHIMNAFGRLICEDVTVSLSACEEIPARLWCLNNL